MEGLLLRFSDLNCLREIESFIDTVNHFLSWCLPSPLSSWAQVHSLQSLLNTDHHHSIPKEFVIKLISGPRPGPRERRCIILYTQRTWEIELGVILRVVKRPLPTIYVRPGEPRTLLLVISRGPSVAHSGGKE